jgi:hypothetical protein
MVPRYSVYRNVIPIALPEAFHKEPLEQASDNQATLRRIFLLLPSMRLIMPARLDKPEIMES